MHLKAIARMQVSSLNLPKPENPPFLRFTFRVVDAEGVPAQPGDLLMVELCNLGPLPGDEWGFTGTFDRENGGGFLTDHFPHATKAIWHFDGIYASSRHIPGVRFAGRGKGSGMRMGGWGGWRRKGCNKSRVCYTWEAVCGLWLVCGYVGCEACYGSSFQVQHLSGVHLEETPHTL